MGERLNGFFCLEEFGLELTATLVVLLEGFHFDGTDVFFKLLVLFSLVGEKILDVFELAFEHDFLAS